MPPESYRTLKPERAGRSVKVWDVAVTMVLLVLLTLFTIGASYAGVLLRTAADACTAQTCDYPTMNAGVSVGVISPWVLLVLAVAFAILLLVKRRIAFWVPLVSASLMVGMWFVGAAIVGLGISR